jgi:hypothetical protein
MPVSPVSDFKSAIAGLKPDNTPMWAKALADAVDGLVTNKAGLGVVTGTFTFTFNKALFMTGIMALTATVVTPMAAQLIGVAWGNAMLSSTMVTAPGAFIGAPAPPTLFSVIISTVIDPPSIVAAQTALIATLSVMQAVEVAQDSALAPALHTAFMSCTATITGLDSTPTPAGPLPLTAPLNPFL